jgi:hypothetical protein
VGWCKEAAGLTLWNFATDTVVGNMTLYAKWEFVPVTGINTVPADGIVGEAVDLSAAAVEPPDASAQTILWTVSSAGTTGVAPASTGPFVPTATGTLKLTATVHNGKAGADGNPVDYTREFTITIIKIRKVTDISNVPTNGFVDIDVDLGGATVIPDNASKKTIVWSVKTAGAGITTISGHAFKPTSTGTVVLTATIANGNEDDSGTISDYTKDFAIRVDDPASVGGNVGFGEDTTIKLYSGATELIAGTVTTVAQDAVYRVSIDSGYTNVVWRLNGLQSTVTGNALILDTRKTGVIRLTVEAERSGAVDTGTYTFRIQ